MGRQSQHADGVDRGFAPDPDQEAPPLGFPLRALPWWGVQGPGTFFTERTLITLRSAGQLKGNGSTYLVDNVGGIVDPTGSLLKVANGARC